EVGGGLLEGLGGTVAGNLSETGGDVPLGSNVNTPGSLNVSGNYADSSTGSLEVVLKGRAAGQFSAMHVTGGVGLTGGTLQLDQAQNFTLLGGQTFDLVTFAPGSLTGKFGATKFGNFTGTGDGVGIGNGLQLFVD